MRARPVIALLAALVLVAACGTDAERGSPLDPAVGTSAPPGVTPGAEQVPGGAPGAEVPEEGDAPPASTPGPGGSDPTGAGTAPPASTPAAAAPAPAPGGVGAFAGFYLRPAESSSILLEVLAQPEAAPRPETVARVAAVLGAVSGKEVTTTAGGLEGGARPWTADGLRALADATGAAQSRDQAVLTLLFVDGGFAENERAVGVAVRSDVAAVFADRVDEAAGPLGNRGAIEEAVTVHEVGHLLGLVDLVLDTGRQDPEHPGHSPNRGSVMYYAVESTLIGSILTGGPPRDFDQADLDDLARIRGG